MKGRQGTDDDANDEDDEDDDEWADIPDNERLFNSDDTIATPAYRHLFE